MMYRTIARMPDLVPLQQAAGEFGVNPATLHRYIKKGKLKRWRREMDKRTYVDRDELRRLLEFRSGPDEPQDLDDLLEPRGLEEP
jgi:hypothetical protein